MTSESVVEWEGCSFRFDKRQSLFFIPLSCSLPRYLCKLWACYLQSKFGHEIIRLGTVRGIPETICLLCFCIVPSSASNASAIESDCRKLFINCPHKWLWNSQEFTFQIVRVEIWDNIRSVLLWSGHSSFGGLIASSLVHFTLPPPHSQHVYTMTTQHSCHYHFTYQFAHSPESTSTTAAGCIRFGSRINKSEGTMERRKIYI